MPSWLHVGLDLRGAPLTVDVCVHSNDTVGHDLRLVQLDIRQNIAYKQLLVTGETFAIAGGGYLSGIRESARRSDRNIKSTPGRHVATSQKLSDTSIASSKRWNFSISTRLIGA